MLKHPTPFTWRFAPNLGGPEYGSSAAQAHFANDPLRKMVREILQNSLDHPAPGLEKVDVTFQIMEIDPQDICADQLKEHVGAALQQLTQERNDPATSHYQKIMQVLSRPSITCLAILDAGTTGLQEDNWQNLIFREGTPTNTQGESKGGSFGFGKNAPFNLSDCNTVLYSTRYISHAKRGVIQHTAGRSQLVSHHNPQRPEEKLQQVGFLAVHQKDKPNQPIQGPQIPQAFRLKETGTGIFIIGFDPGPKDWTREIAHTTVTQFFYAIQTGKLSVTIKGESQAKTAQEIDRTTLQAEIERLPEKDPTHHYHAAITQEEPLLTEPSNLLNQDQVDKSLQLWVTVNREAPRRLAHINRRGMLVTQARQSHTNPFYPEGGSAWTGWAGVSMAKDDPTDQFIRLMEPPAHDAVQFRQLREDHQQDSAQQELQHQRAQITHLVREKINEYLANDSENITELADLFPETSPEEAGQQRIKTRMVKTREERDLGQEDQDEETTQISPSPESGDGEDQVRNREDRGPQPTAPQPEQLLQDVRLIRTAPGELTMSLLMPNTSRNTLHLQVRNAGEQHQRDEEAISIREIAPCGDMLVSADLARDSIKLTAPGNTPVVLRLKLQDEDQPYRSYAVIQTSQPEVNEE